MTLSYGVRFVAVSQALDTDASNPSSRLMRRPRRVFRRDEAIRMRAEGQSWRAIAAALNVPLSTLHGVFGS